MREEVIGDCRLILGDCRDALPHIQADHIFTDPPYEDELHKAMGKLARIRSDGVEGCDDLGFEGINSIREDISRLMVSSSNGWLLAFTLAEGVRAWRDEIQKFGGKWDTTCVWVKPDATPRMNGQGPARGFENFVLAWCGSGYRGWNRGGKRGIYTHCANPSGRVSHKDGGHPTEKPLSLMAELVSDFTKAGQTILDPFMGSGTTGVACVSLGRSFIGIEKDRKWFDLSCRRIEEAYKQPRLFDDPVAKKEQGKLEL